MSTFAIMQARILSELRRPSLTTEVKAAINDAVDEAAKDRFWFNEQRGLTFNTVAGTEYYSDQGLTEFDDDGVYFYQGTSRRNINKKNNVVLNELAEGGPTSSQVINYSRHDTKIRLYPVPNVVTAIYLDGYGQLTPYPLVADADTNAWMTTAERYVRALGKKYLLMDVIRDTAEAQVYAALADDYKIDLFQQSALRISSGTLKPTTF